ncbi:Cu-binding protein [Mycoblastus sanguinarius]|nr:Cu-binding protein [Mycoblastus sanguinarius]
MPSKFTPLRPACHARSTVSRCPQSSTPPCSTLRFRVPKTSTSCPHPFSTSSRRSAKTIEQAKSRARSGPFSARSAIIFLSAGVGMIFYFRYEKERLERQRVAEAAKGVGRPKVGGKFELIDQEGERFTDEDMKGGYSLVYFGFSHCPDICPEELDKMAHMIDLVASTTQNRIGTLSFVDPSTRRAPLLPVFITCDPARDTPSVLKSYLKEFHPGLVGLTGTWEQIKDTYPEGDFVEAIGRQHSAERAAKIIVEHMFDWKGGVKQ